MLYCPSSKLGGAMAPAIKELSQWLDTNIEYFVAPDWADVVKHSVSLVNCMFVYFLITRLKKLV